ncbi:MAG: OmpA family protein [Lysobacter sp.]
MKRHTSARASRAIIIALLPFALAACGGDTSPPADAADTPTPAVAEAPPSGATDAQAASPAESTPGEAAPDAVDRFDIESVPVSDAPLGEFPYFSIPDGYREDPLDTRQLDFAQAAFWTGDRIEVVEGRVYATGIRVKRDSGKQFSSLEVLRDLEQLITSAGGVEIAAGEVPKLAREDEAIESIKGQYDTESTCYAHQPVQVFVLRHAKGDIWVRTCKGGKFVGLIVAQAEALTPTATLLPASELKQQLDAAGKVALQVNFATDKAEILPDSQPQIDQVVQLLKDDPALELSVNGHTDDTGDAAHNQQLSEARAGSVVAALTAQGIAAERLDAQGFGQDRPVADNGTEEGKAKNRRVELVRL